MSLNLVQLRCGTSIKQQNVYLGWGQCRQTCKSSARPWQETPPRTVATVFFCKHTIESLDVGTAHGRAWCWLQAVFSKWHNLVARLLQIGLHMLYTAPDQVLCNALLCASQELVQAVQAGHDTSPRSSMPH